MAEPFVITVIITLFAGILGLGYRLNKLEKDMRKLKEEHGMTEPERDANGYTEKSSRICGVVFCAVNALFALGAVYLWRHDLVSELAAALDPQSRAGDAYELNLYVNIATACMAASVLTLFLTFFLAQRLYASRMFFVSVVGFAFMFFNGVFVIIACCFPGSLFGMVVMVVCSAVAPVTMAVMLMAGTGNRAVA